MVDLADIPEAVVWHEGMLLAPQHFQQSNRRLESVLGYHLNVASQFYWGVRRLTVDTAGPVSTAGPLVDGPQLRRLMRDRDMAGAERAFATLSREDVDKAYNELQFMVQDEIDVHQVVLAWRAWETPATWSK